MARAKASSVLVRASPMLGIMPLPWTLVEAESQTQSPRVVLGALAEGGVAPSIFALVEHGSSKRPALAAQTTGDVELRFDEGYPPVQIHFKGDEILVQDGGDGEPDLVVAGTMPDIVHLTATPLVGGVPSPASGRGRAALARMARGRVTIEGDRRLGRRLLRILAL